MPAARTMSAHFLVSETTYARNSGRTRAIQRFDIVEQKPERLAPGMLRGEAQADFRHCLAIR
jgi:hypothetical protein